MIVTSYYSNYRSYQDYIRISISRTTPKGGCDLKLLDFAPKLDLLYDYKKGLINNSQYTIEYTEQLQKLYESGKMSRLVELLQEEDKVVLLCYEKKGKFCHRHLLANFLNTHYNLNIHEL